MPLRGSAQVGFQRLLEVGRRVHQLHPHGEAVISRALGSGPKAGLAVVTGLVAADLVFLGIAFVGLLAIATTMGPMFQIVKYAGAAYLIWRGYRAFIGTDHCVAVQAEANGILWQDVGPSKPRSPIAR